TDVHTAFNEGTVGISACGFAHNATFSSEAVLWSHPYADLLNQWPLFAGDQADEFATFLDGQLTAGDGAPVLQDVLKGRYHPHKRLLDHTARMIRREPTYVLLDEQKVAFNDILGRARDRQLSAEQTAFLIRGGPGTGKSVIAVNLVAELSGD